jgi:hypothetical protein
MLYPHAGNPASTQVLGWSAFGHAAAIRHTSDHPTGTATTGLRWGQRLPRSGRRWRFRTTEHTGDRTVRSGGQGRLLPRRP